MFKFIRYLAILSVFVCLEVAYPKVKAISFDCAGTLVEVNWDNIAPIVVETAKEYGYNIQDVQEAERVFRELWALSPELGNSLKTSYSSKGALMNMPTWINFIADWLQGAGLCEGCWGKSQAFVYAPAIMYSSYRKAKNPGSPLFSLYSKGSGGDYTHDDTVVILNKLQEEGYPLFMVSNWNSRLTAILKHTESDEDLKSREINIYHYFKAVTVSDDCGIEKPDPQIFLLALKTFNELPERGQEYAIKPEEVLHVGDLMGDDVQGAKSAGMHAVHIDRTKTESDYENGIICRLGDLPGYIEHLNEQSGY